MCDSVRESGNVLFWYLPFSGAQFKVLFVGIFSPAPSSILPSDFSSTVFFRLVEIYSDSHCTVGGNMSYHDPESYQTKRRRVRSRAHVDYIFQEHAADTESETESILML